MKGEPTQVVDLGLDGVYPSLQVWDAGEQGATLRWLHADGVTWSVFRHATPQDALSAAAELAPLVTAALASGARLSQICNDEG